MHLKSGLIRTASDGRGLRPKLRNCLFPAPDRPLENVVTRNIFWAICDDFFYFGYRKSWPEVPILFQNLRSELVYTFKWKKSVVRLWRNQICEWTLEKKKKSPYLSTHRWNGGSGAGNEHIFKGGLTLEKLQWMITIQSLRQVNVVCIVYLVYIENVIQDLLNIDLYEPPHGGYNSFVYTINNVSKSPLPKDKSHLIGQFCSWRLKYERVNDDWQQTPSQTCTEELTKT